MNARTGFIGLIAAVGVLAVAPLASAKTYDYTSKFVSAPLSTANGYPNPGGTAVLAGSLEVKSSARASGSGAWGSPRYIDNGGMPGWEEGGSFVPQSFIDIARDAGARNAASNPFSGGALIDRVTVTGHPEPNVFTFKGKEVDYFLLGTMRNKFTGTATVHEDGSQTLAGAGRFTGGSGRYRGTSGRYKFKATVPAGSTTTTGGSTGRIDY